MLIWSRTSSGGGASSASALNGPARAIPPGEPIEKDLCSVYTGPDCGFAKLRFPQHVLEFRESGLEVKQRVSSRLHVRGNSTRECVRAVVCNGGMSTEGQHAMASSLRSIVDASERLRLSQGGVIAREDSAAAKEYEGADSDQLERALSESHQQGLKALVAGFDLAAGAAELAGRPDRAFSVMSLLRSSTEAAANSFWYLDPTIEPSLRESRAIGGVRVAVGAARRFGRKSGVVFDDDFLESLANLERDIASHSSDPRTPPSMEARLRRLARVLDLDDSLADAGYEALSSVSHVTKNALDQIVLGWDDDGNAELTTHTAAEWAIWYAANLLLAAVLSAARYFGWDDSEWLSEVAEHADALQDAINEIREER